MIYYNANCNTASRNCVSGCCTNYGYCATISSECLYPYSDRYTNSSKYYYPGQYADPTCNSLSRTCSTGCCTSSGKCASNTYDCLYYYSDFYTNSSKYYLPVYTQTTNSAPGNANGAAIGGPVGGVVLFIILITLIIWCKKKKAADLIAQNSLNTTRTENNGTTILMTNNHPQPVYGMNQPMVQPTYTQPYQPIYQPVQPIQPMQPAFMQPSYGMGGMGMQPQSGPIIY